MHKNLDVWNLAIGLVKDVYKLTKDYPEEELYGLTAQIRRSAISIPSNIAEGAARNSKKEFAQFLYIALGSAAELETQLIIAQELGYGSSQEIYGTLLRIKQMLLGLIKTQRSRI